MAAGKNAVSALLEKNGFVSLDADLLVHKAIDSLTEEIKAAFSREAKESGISIQNADGSINRKALGSLIFPHPELLKRQENLVYPKILEMTKDFINQSENSGKNIILNATVLYKTPDLMVLCEKIVFVDAPLLTRLRRAKKRDSLPSKKILERFRTQRTLFSEYKKTGIPIIKIRNTGSLKSLEKKLSKKKLF